MTQINPMSFTEACITEGVEGLILLWCFLGVSRCMWGPLFYNSSWESTLFSSLNIQGNGATSRLSDFLKVTQLASAKPGFEPRFFSWTRCLSTTLCRLSLVVRVPGLEPKWPVSELLPAPGEVQRWRQREVHPEGATPLATVINQKIL